MTAFADRHYRSLLFAIWLATSLALLAIAWNAIADWKMGDPDDQLRLVQVRDWLAGQSWWDITQYRMNPPDGGPMHWSRLVDVPIAALILLLRPLVGPAAAELWASALLPLFTYGCVLAVFAAMVRRLFGSGAALLAAALLFTILPAMAQLLPMRIDHHGWQLFCFFVAGWVLFDPLRRLSSAGLAGLALALWMEISIEGLPFAVLFMGVYGLRWLFPRQLAGREGELAVALAALSGATGFFYLVTEGFNPASHCDGLSPFHIGALAAVTAVVGAATLVTRGKPVAWPVKIGIAAVAGAAGLAVVLSVAPQCTHDAFAGLDPLVRHYWYERVPEGLPLWAVQLDFAMQQIWGVAFGLVGLVWLLWRAEHPFMADRIALALLFLGSAVVGTLVTRTMVYAVCLATVMLAPMAIGLFVRAEAAKGLALRMAWRVVAIALLLPTILGQNFMNRLNALNDAADPKAAAIQKAFEKQARACQKPRAAMALNRLPKSTLMVGLDSSPAVLQFTRHTVVATGHHRNQAAMADVIRTFTGSTADAEAAIRKRGAQYLIGCDGSFELHTYKTEAPNGFWSRMEKGEVPRWLVRQPDIGPFHIWRVDWGKR